MKISLNWLKQYIDLPESADEISELLTMSGLEVEGIEQYETIKGSMEGLVIGQVITCEPHPNADKLSKTTVDIGEEALAPIVCGAPNVAVGQKVIVAQVGSTLYPSHGAPLKIKKAKIRDEVSEGMICAEDEIGIGMNHEGILVLDTDLPVGTPAADYFNIETDQVFEIGLTPNRADATSHIGVARDLRALLERQIQMPDLEHFQVDQPGSPIEVVVENKQGCLRYSGLYFEDISVGPSPAWLQHRLLSIGLSPINNIVDITNFVMHELGQPMHAFDADKIAQGKIIVKTLGPGATFTTLDEKERKLLADDLMICDGDSHGLCIAGVFGGIKSGVTDKTQRVFLESAYFSPEYIRKTAQHHGLKTDASFRYERGTDPQMTIKALKRAALLLKEIAGAKIASDLLDIYPEKVEAWPVQVRFSQINRLIGQVIPPDRVIKILQLLDFHIESASEQEFIAMVPPYRVDVKREADVIEEILRIYGYNNISLDDHLHSDYLAEFPQIDPSLIRFGLAKLLAAAGFIEIYTNSLTKPAYATEAPGIEPDRNVVIINQLSEDLAVLRQNMLFTGLETLVYNISHKQTNLKLFELGKIYRKNPTNEGTVTDRYFESNRLAIYLSGQAQSESWIAPGRAMAFHDLSGTIDEILKKFGIDQHQSNPLESQLFDYGIALYLGNELLLEMGKVKKSVCQLAGMRQEVFYADIDWDLLVKQSKDNILYQEVSKYPEVRRDLSLVVENHINYKAIRALALKSERKLLKKINVFDVYQGDKIDADKKAYALSFILQDQNGTLTDNTIDKCMGRLINAFEKELNAIIRK